MQSDYNDLTVVKLKALCKEQNLPISGRKSELIERLIANDNSKYDNEEEIEQTTEEGQKKKEVQMHRMFNRSSCSLDIQRYDFLPNLLHSSRGWRGGERPPSETGAFGRVASVLGH